MLMQSSGIHLAIDLKKQKSIIQVIHLEHLEDLEALAERCCRAQKQNRMLF